MNNKVRLVANVLVALGIMIAAGGLLTTNVMRRGQIELQASRGQVATGKLEQAVVHARNAASAYVPAAPHVAAAYRQLVEIARKAEGQGDIDTALFAWQALRSAALQTRWVIVTHNAQLQVANASIARLSATKPPASGASIQDTGQIQQHLHMMLTTPRYPAAMWVIVIVSSFAMGAAGLIYTGLKGFTQKGEVVTKHLRIGLVVTATAVILWLTALWFA